MGNKNQKEQEVMATQKSLIVDVMRGRKINLTPSMLNFKCTAVSVTQYKWNLLHLAVWFERTDLVKELIDYGMDVNEEDAHGETPLFLASMKADHELTYILEEAIGHTVKTKFPHMGNRIVPEDTLKKKTELDLSIDRS